MQGDGDPLDICILTEKTIPHCNILMQAIPIGGLRMIDNKEADDKDYSCNEKRCRLWRV